MFKIMYGIFLGGGGVRAYCTWNQNSTPLLSGLVLDTTGVRPPISRVIVDCFSLITYNRFCFWHWSSPWQLCLWKEYTFWKEFYDFDISYGNKISVTGVGKKKINIKFYKAKTFEVQWDRLVFMSYLLL